DAAARARGDRGAPLGRRREGHRRDRRGADGVRGRGRTGRGRANIEAMSDTQAIARLFDYCEWANRRYLDAVAPLDPETFARDLKGSHGGIRGTLVHTYGAEWVWLQRFKGSSPPALPGQDEIHDLPALRGRWTALEGERRAWLEALGPDA